MGTTIVATEIDKYYIGNDTATSSILYTILHHVDTHLFRICDLNHYLKPSFKFFLTYYICINILLLLHATLEITIVYKVQFIYLKSLELHFNIISSNWY